MGHLVEHSLGLEDSDMVGLVSRQQSPLVQQLLAQGFAPSRPIRSGIEAFAEAFRRGQQISLARQQITSAEAQRERQQEAFSSGIEALFPEQVPEAGTGSGQGAGLPTEQQGPDLRRALVQFAQAGPQASNLASVLFATQFGNQEPAGRVVLSPEQVLVDEQSGNEIARGRDRQPSAQFTGVLRQFHDAKGRLPENDAELFNFAQGLRGKDGFSFGFDPETGTVTFSTGDSGDGTFLTDVQKGKRFAQFQDSSKAVLEGLNTAGNMVDILRENPQAIGVPGALSRIANEFTASVTGTFGMSREDDARLAELLANGEDLVKGLPSGIRKLAVANAEYRSDLIRAAFAAARAAGNTGNSLSNKDFEKFLQAFGGMTSDPATALNTLTNLFGQSVSNIRDAALVDFQGDQAAAAERIVNTIDTRFQSIFGGPSGTKSPQSVPTLSREDLTRIIQERP